MIGWQGRTGQESILEAYGHFGPICFYATTREHLVCVLRETIKLTRADVGLRDSEFPIRFDVASFEFTGRPSKDLLICCLNQSQFKSQDLAGFELLIDEDLEVTPSGAEPWCADCETDAADHGKYHWRFKRLLCLQCTTAADARRRLGERVG
ncbi:hypothetical protein LCGC14_1078340 [marine sediment metagenome]|uniref:Uncharacterized protein n=1 Tax=marine sediment metagenome TaxID=412755 RepID=A0A0F9QLW4_9ZZZZ